MHYTAAQGTTLHACSSCIPVAGHSLGGALATLCAFDIASAIKEAGALADDGTPIDVCCYTFGAPRTGNRAFRNEFNALVPNCWGIINDQVRYSEGTAAPLCLQLILLMTQSVEQKPEVSQM